MNNAVPFLDLISPHLELEEELIVVFRDALKTGRFIGGPVVDSFEKDFAAFCDAQYCIGVASGTDALRFALIAAGVRQGETVITVPNTFIATTEAISQAGAYIAFMDINERTYNIDPEKISTALAPPPGGGGGGGGGGTNLEKSRFPRISRSLQLLSRQKPRRLW